MLLYAVERYHLNQKIGETKYFFTETEMKNYIELNNKMEQDMYRGFILDALKIETQKSDLDNIKNFSEFEPLVKPEYKFLAKKLYTKMIEGREPSKTALINDIGLIKLILVIVIIIISVIMFRSTSNSTVIF